MFVSTLIIGRVPLESHDGKKPREVRLDTYFKETFRQFDLGEVNHATYQNWKEKCDQHNPLFIITFSDYEASQIKEYKKDALIYVTYDPGQVFYRKAEIDNKKLEQQKTLKEIESMIRKTTEDGEEKLPALRKFASMSYDDIYRMIIQAIIGDDEKLRKQAWELLNDDNAHKNFIWMRAQLICEIWDHCDGKGKEEFLCMAMDQHIDNGIARKLDNFTDEDEQEFHQYMFCSFSGFDLNYIRRIPLGTKGQDKYNYQAILDKYKTPNGPQVMLEAGQLKARLEEYQSENVS